MKKIKAKKVIAFSKTGRLVGIFCSMHAASAIARVPTPNISVACANLEKGACIANHYWRILDEDIKIKIGKTKLVDYDALHRRNSNRLSKKSE